VPPATQTRSVLFAPDCTCSAPAAQAAVAGDPRAVCAVR
jgi:hypothetical protein